MKKFLPYILILVIIANIFAPFSVFVGDKNKLEISKNQANATGIISFIVKQTSNTDTTITLNVYIEIEEPTMALSGYEIIGDLAIKDSSGIEIKKHVLDLAENGGILRTSTTKNGTLAFSGNLILNELKPATKYTLTPSLKYVVHVSDFLGLKDTYEPDPAPQTIPINTFDSSNPGSGLEENFKQSSSGTGALPQCGISPVTDKGTIAGCGVQILYYGVFIPTSYLFGLSGKFFDATFGYSIQDSSYRSGFVTEGWAIVRDFCNLFFIFVLIYAAFGMILSIHSIKSKEIIINTIIIGLLINFSLLAGQLLIDTSNILARVFYNSEAIKITVDQQGKPVTRGGVNMYDTTMGELPLSAALVNKIEPQNLIIEASRTQVNDDVQNTSSTADSTDLGIGAYFLVILLAIIVNIIGTFVFISIGLIFVARVIGLWFALIFAPLAFFSYTVPQMQGIAMVGWKKWWPETMGLAFVAPIFMFFMYLILVFLEKGFVSLLETSKNGPNFVLSIIIPFAFIMILLMTAKKLAKDYSGQMGQTITGAVTATGAALLGGAALGVAFAGRTAIGRPLKSVSNSRSALHMDEHKDKMKSYQTKHEEWKKNGSIGPAPVKPIAPQHGDIIGKDKKGKDIKYNAFVGAWGSQMNSRETDQSHIIHTRHELDEISKKEFNGQTYGELGAGQKQKAKDLLTEEKAKKKYDKISREEYGMDYKDSSMTVANKARVRDLAKMMAKSDVEHSADSKIGLDSSLQTSMRKGSYDIRNLSALGTNNMDSIFNKLGTKLMVGIGMGMRMGFKSSGINHGTGQKDFFKDISNTITEALKNVKIEVPKGGGGGHDDHGGGHDDHGHGGGGGGHH